jgi:beta-xylosidase
MATGCQSSSVGSCGFNLNHTVNLATSTDLVHWSFQGTVYSPSDRPAGILYSPWVAQSKTTGKYVLWTNILPVNGGHGDFDNSRYTVAVSDSPFGPFKTVVDNVTGMAYTRLPDAASIFVDDDSSAYIAFTHEDTHINHVQQLTPDLLGPLPAGQVGPQIGPGNYEGAFMFKRNNTYYFGAGPCCCFCGEGSNVVIWSSATPLGPYDNPVQVIGAADWRGQTGAVWWTGADWVLYGDRWQSASDSIKAHDYSYWAAIQFSANNSAVPLPGHQDWVLVRY